MTALVADPMGSPKLYGGIINGANSWMEWAMPGQVEVRDVQWEPETKAMPADGPLRPFAAALGTSAIGTRPDKFRACRDRRE